jgi:Ulp1 family protease
MTSKEKNRNWELAQMESLSKQYTMSLSSSSNTATGVAVTAASVVRNEEDDDILLLNFHDAVIYKRDLNLLLNERGWLNDAIIHFYFEYLQQQSPAIGDYFMDPSVVSYFMHQCIENDDIQEFVQSAPFPSPSTIGTRGRIFIAVNDYMMPSSSSWLSLSSTAQGTHWSLLVIDIQVLDHDDEDMPILLAHHFDSHGPSDTNHLVARKIFEKIFTHVYQHPHGTLSTNKFSAVDSDANVFFLEASSGCKIPQQVNGHDCGVHVLGAAEILSSSSFSSSSWSNKHIINCSSNKNTTSTLSSYIAQLQGEDNEQAIRQHIGSDPAKFCTDLRKKIASIILQN